MLPFSNIDFYIIAAMLVVYLLLAKWLLKKVIPYETNILIVNLAFLLFFFPHPYHVFGLILISYGLTYLFSTILKLQNKLLGTILLLAPMILVKSDIRFNLYPFELNNWLSFAGLSYISFRIASVYIESNPGDRPPRFTTYVNYLTFFPSLLIGPIDRLKRYTDNLAEGYSGINWTKFTAGWQLLLLGIFYKYICAEVTDRYWLSLYDSSSHEPLYMFHNMYGYFFYLFFDFAGYSAMAIGVGKMIGIDLPINFDKPFIARNPQDFWRRFHKSLGDWLGDYFFKPFYLFFSRKKSLKKYPLTRQNIALFSTFLLMGFWNGFQSNFIISGALFGLYSVGYNSYVYYCRKNKRDVIFGQLNEKLVTVISIFIMFNLAAISIYIFSGRCPLI